MDSESQLHWNHGKTFGKFNNTISITFVMFINNDCVRNNIEILVKRLKENFVKLF